MSDTANEAFADISAPVETVEVVIDQTAPSVLDKPEFLSDVINHLLCARGKGHKMVAAASLAKCLRVGWKDLDEWGKTQPRLLRRTSAKCGSDVVYYGLAKPQKVIMGNSEFDQLLMIVLTEDDKKWKSIAYLAKQLEQDEKALAETLDKYSGVLRRIGKEQKVYYALASRFEDKPDAENKNTNKTKTTAKTTATSEELLALGMIHPLSDGFLRAMHFYGNRLAVNHPDAYAHLAIAQKELSSGIALLMNSLGIKDKQMPDLESI